MPLKPCHVGIHRAAYKYIDEYKQTSVAATGRHVMPPVQTLQAQRHIIRPTFRVRHIAEAKLVTRVYVSVCLSVCLSLAAFPHYCTDPDVTWGTVGGAL